MTEMIYRVEESNFMVSHAADSQQLDMLTSVPKTVPLFSSANEIVMICACSLRLGAFIPRSWPRSVGKLTLDQHSTLVQLGHLCWMDFL
jgi:hypothetical protein